MSWLLGMYETVTIMFALDQLQMRNVVNLQKFVVHEFEILLVQAKKFWTNDFKIGCHSDLSE